MAPTDATYFYMTDQRATDKTKPAQQPQASSSSSGAAVWTYARAR